MLRGYKQASALDLAGMELGICARSAP